MTTPVWLLAVDGVINMLANRPEDTAWRQSQCVQTTVTKPDLTARPGPTGPGRDAADE